MKKVKRGQDAKDGQKRSLEAAEYVLGLADPAEDILSSDRARTDQIFAQEVEVWQNHLVALVETEIAEQTPPPNVQKRLSRSIHMSRERFPSRVRLIWDSLTFWRMMATSATVTAIIAAMLFINKPDGEMIAASYYVHLQGPEVNLTFLAKGSSGAEGMILTSIPTINKVADVSNSTGVRKLWLLPNDDKPIELGVLPINPKVQLLIPYHLVPLLKDAKLAISAETQIGSPKKWTDDSFLATGKFVSL
ncbi:MAG: hypothetical protein HRU27_14195 [Rhizobiaceae bacterium]|nr:hypothetical protein [Rhizobiaceae bacterium]